MSDLNSNDEKLKILRMVEEDKITAEEAIILLNAVSRNKSNAPSPSESKPTPFSESPRNGDVPTAANGKWRFFRVRVTDTRSNRPKALVTIPIGLMEWGLKIGALFSPEVSKINIEDFNSLLESGIDGKLVDVLDEEDGEHVEVFVE